jgi:hypothetical protein
MLQYPPEDNSEELTYGVLPVDFLLETVLEQGLAWYLADINNSKLVFGHLGKSWLASKYGQAKIEQIWNYLNTYECPIVQHFSLIDQTRPCLSIQLLDGSEMIERTGLNDHMGSVDVLNAESELIGRKNVTYSPILDNVHIGIHVINTPDLAKYLYYIVVYILNAYKPQLEARGLQLSTFRATDISRLNEYLPENMFSRFVNFSCSSYCAVDSGAVPIIDSIQGIHMGPRVENDINGNPMPTCDETDVSAERVTDTFGLTACDIRQRNE